MVRINAISFLWEIKNRENCLDSFYNLAASTWRCKLKLNAHVSIVSPMKLGGSDSGRRSLFVPALLCLYGRFFVVEVYICRLPLMDAVFRNLWNLMLFFLSDGTYQYEVKSRVSSVKFSIMSTLKFWKYWIYNNNIYY